MFGTKNVVVAQLNKSWTGGSRLSKNSVWSLVWWWLCKMTETRGFFVAKITNFIQFYSTCWHVHIVSHWLFDIISRAVRQKHTHTHWISKGDNFCRQFCPDRGGHVYPRHCDEERREHPCGRPACIRIWVVWKTRGTSSRVFCKIISDIVAIGCHGFEDEREQIEMKIGRTRYDYGYHDTCIMYTYYMDY